MHEAPEMLPGDIVYIAIALQRGRPAPGLVVQPVESARIEVVYEHPDGRIVGGLATWSLGGWHSDGVAPHREDGPRLQTNRVPYANQLLRYLDDPQQMRQHADEQDHARRRRRRAAS